MYGYGENMSKIYLYGHVQINRCKLRAHARLAFVLALAFAFVNLAFALAILFCLYHIANANASLGPCNASLRHRKSIANAKARCA